MSLKRFSRVCLWKNFLGNIRGMTSGEFLWGVSLERSSREYERGASLSGALLWGVSLERFSGVCLWRDFIDCCCVSLERFSEIIRGMPLWKVSLGCVSEDTD